jgi:uncharacterized alpha-E superfamily protein
MLSRVAESLYWMSRNIERAESLARIIDVAFNRTVDRIATGGERARRVWSSVLELAGGPEEIPRFDGPTLANDAFAYGTFSTENRSSVISCIRIARSNALGVRAELTTEVWEAINSMYLFVEAQSPRAIAREGPSSFLRKVRGAVVRRHRRRDDHARRRVELLANRPFSRACLDDDARPQDARCR